MNRTSTTLPSIYLSWNCGWKLNDRQHNRIIAHLVELAEGNVDHPWPEHWPDPGIPHLHLVPRPLWSIPLGSDVASVTIFQLAPISRRAVKSRAE
jgi:hypothetical protein